MRVFVVITLCALLQAIKIAVVGSHAPNGRLAKIRASSHGWDVISVTRQDHSGFLTHSPSVSHIIVDGTVVTPRGVQMLHERHPNTPIGVAFNKDDAVIETDRIFGSLI